MVNHEIQLFDALGSPFEGTRPRAFDAAEKEIRMSKKNMLPRFARTDLGNAEMFAHVMRDSLRYDHKRDRWLVWHKHWWTIDNDGAISRRAKDTSRIRAEAALCRGGEEGDRETKWALYSESLPRLEAMVKLARVETPLSDIGEGWDSDPMLLGVANGVIDLRTGTLRDGKPEDKITLHSDIIYDPSAQCPRFIEFIDQVFSGDSDLIEFVQRAIGYCLTGDTREQCLFACHGGGSNGKSTLLEVIRFILGGYAYNLPFSAFELDKRSSIPNDLAPLPGRRFVTAIETNESAQLNEGRIKLLTGCDPLSARFLRCEFFTFVPVGKYWLSFNNAPMVMDYSHGFWRRVRIIPFRKQFDGAAADDELLTKLKTEGAGILAWAVQGCLKWLEVGLEMPQAIRDATAAYREESDPLADFIEELIVVGPGERVEAGTLYDKYIGWASDNFERALDRKAFSRRLIAKGFVKKRVGKNRTWTWFGISLRCTNETKLPLMLSTPSGGRERT
jgi:putative DNA primase/helicase